MRKNEKILIVDKWTMNYMSATNVQQFYRKIFQTNIKLSCVFQTSSSLSLFMSPAVPILRLISSKICQCFILDSRSDMLVIPTYAADI